MVNVTGVLCAVSQATDASVLVLHAPFPVPDGSSPVLRCSLEECGNLVGWALTWEGTGNHDGAAWSEYQTLVTTCKKVSRGGDEIDESRHRQKEMDMSQSSHLD